MAGWVLLGVVLTLQMTGETEGAAGAQPDLCRFGSFGPGAALSDLRPVELELEGVEAFEGPVPTVDIIDPCGLRYSDLSGVWTFNGYQVVGYHDLRTGRFRMRLTHVPYDRPYFETWALRFGYPVLEGVVGPEAEDIRLGLNSVYPPRVRDTCPDQYEHFAGYLSIALAYDEDGRVVLTATRPLASIDDACVQSLDRFVTDRVVRTGVEGAP